MRKKILSGNWKMNFSKGQALDFLQGLEDLFASKGPNPISEMRIYAPAVFLDSLATLAKQKNLPLVLGAQNIHFEASGAYTGETSAEQLKSIHINHSLIGHSERRQYFAETDETVLKKCKSLLPLNFDLLVCIGETLQERETGKTWDVLKRQLTGLVSETALLPYWGKSLNLAYEPVWAIGTGKTASPEQAEEVHAWIRNFLSENGLKEKADQVGILYGGSVSPANFADLMTCKNIDGGLVGGASLKLDTWKSLWKQLD